MKHLLKKNIWPGPIGMAKEKEEEGEEGRKEGSEGRKGGREEE